MRRGFRFNIGSTQKNAARKQNKVKDSRNSTAANVEAGSCDEWKDFCFTRRVFLSKKKEKKRAVRKEHPQHTDTDTDTDRHPDTETDTPRHTEGGRD